MKILKNKEISVEEAKSLSFHEVNDLIRSDPVTCMRHFDHRQRALFNCLLKPAAGLFAPYKLKEYFTRLEFQMRGSPHSHGLYWIENAPVYQESDPNSLQACVKFIDEFITCERCEDEEMEPIIGYQIHKHSQTCWKNARKGKQCRFGFPKPPMDATTILSPLGTNSGKECERTEAVRRYKRIDDELNLIGRSYKEDIPLEDFIRRLRMTKEDYMLAVRSSISRPTVFLKRSTNAIFINGYNKNLLIAWQANIDFQFVLDTYACAKYCVGYILKSDGGVSKALQAAAADAKRGNVSVKEKLKKYANILINGSEISAQEAAAYLLGIGNTSCSRMDVFVNTSPPCERIGILKSTEKLKELEDSSNEIFARSIIDYYTLRPENLEEICLAEFATYYEISKSKGGSCFTSAGRINF